MAEQNIGGFDVGLDQQSMQMLEDVVQSSLMVAEHMEKAGLTTAAIAEHLKNVSSSQQAVVDSLRTYDFISKNIVESVQELRNINKNILDVQKDTTFELQKQTAEGKKQINQRKEGEDFLRKEAEDQGKRVSKSVLHPLDTLSKSIMSKLPGWAQGIAVVGGVAAMEASKSVSNIRNITRTGGQGLSEGVGVSGAMDLDASMRLAALSIPFFKESYGSKQELASGAATMYGYGGIRGDALLEVMDKLPEQAYNLGIRFDDASMLVSKFSRLFGSDAKDLLKKFDLIGETAKEVGEKPADFAKQIGNLTTVGAAYGVTVEEGTSLLGKFVPNVKKGTATYEELNKVIVDSYRKGFTYNQTLERMREAGDTVAGTMLRISDQMELRGKIEDVLKSRAIDSVEVSKLTEKATGDYAVKIKEGARDMGTLTSAMGELLPIMGKEATTAMITFVDDLEGFSKSHGYNSALIVKAGTTFAQTVMKLTNDQELSTKVGTKMAKVFSEDLERLNITLPEANSMFERMVESFNMLPGAAYSNIVSLKKLGDQFGVGTTSMIKFQAGMADGMREMFDTPGEAIKQANVALAATTHLLAEGQVSTADYTKIMRNQMDVFGKSGDMAAVQFNTLAAVVSGTSVRMSELSSQIEQLSKINRQFGFDQQISNGMLVSFNEHLRTGAASIQDFQTIMRGPAGAGEGVKALLTTELAQKGGTMGKMFSGGVLGNIGEMLPDLVRYVGGGRSSNILRGQFGGNKGLVEAVSAAGGRKAMSNQIGESFRDIIKRIIPQDADPATQRNIFRKQAPQLLGGNITAYGEAFEKLFKMSMGKMSMDNFAAVVAKAQADAPKPGIDRVATNTTGMLKSLNSIETWMDKAYQEQKATAEYAQKINTKILLKKEQMRSEAANPRPKGSVKKK